MKALIALACTALAGCTLKDAGPPREEAPVIVGAYAPVRWSNYSAPVFVIHDEERAVTCWTLTGGYNSSSPALSCLPDSQLAKSKKGASDDR